MNGRRGSKCSHICCVQTATTKAMGEEGQGRRRVGKQHQQLLSLHQTVQTATECNVSTGEYPMGCHFLMIHPRETRVYEVCGRVVRMIRPRKMKVRNTFSITNVLLFTSNGMVAPATRAPRPCRPVVRCDAPHSTNYLDGNDNDGGMKDLPPNMHKHQRADHTVDQGQN